MSASRNARPLNCVSGANPGGEGCATRFSPIAVKQGLASVQLGGGPGTPGMSPAKQGTAKQRVNSTVASSFFIGKESSNSARSLSLGH